MAWEGVSEPNLVQSEKGTVTDGQVFVQPVPCCCGMDEVRYGALIGRVCSEERKGSWGTGEEESVPPWTGSSTHAQLVLLLRLAVVR